MIAPLSLGHPLRRGRCVPPDRGRFEADAKMKHLRLLLPLLLIAALAALVLRPRDLHVTLRNTGPATLRNVQLSVTGHTHPLGDLAPNGSRTARLHPTGESNLLIAYTDPTGVTQTLTIDCYLEPGHSGTLSADLANGSVTNVKQKIRSTPG